MIELLKYLIRTIFSIVRSGFARTNERRVLNPRPDREKYPSRASETSRISAKAGEITYLATRVPFRSKCRYSVLFPGVLSRYEEEHFHTQSWARTFSDDRSVPESEAENGLFLCWSDEAYGTQDLFAHTWKIAKQLPNGLEEIHSDGSYLRAIIRGERKEAAAIDYRALRDRLSELAATIQTLTVAPRRRRTLNDRLKYKDILLGIVVVGVCFLLFAIIRPTAHFIMTDFSAMLLSGVVVTTLAITSYFSRGGGILSTLRVGCIRTVFLVLLLVAAYQRLWFSLRSQGAWAEWTIQSVQARHQKYSTNITAYRVELQDSAGAQDSLLVYAKTFGSCVLEVGRTVRMHTFTDPLGIRFADSVVYGCMASDGSELQFELLR